MTDTITAEHDVTIGRKGKRYKVDCSCGFTAIQSDETLAEERRALHLAETTAAEAPAGDIPPTEDVAPSAGEYQMLPTAELVAAHDNPRRDLGDITDLAASIVEQGLIEPLIVTPLERAWLIVAGHRRHAAAIKAGLTQVPCIVREGLDDRARAEIMLVENLQRSNLTPLEEADAFIRLTELGLTQRNLARRLGCSQSHISRRISLGGLPDKARAAIDAGNITIEVALDLAKLPADTIEGLCAKGAPNEWRISEAVHAIERAKRVEQARKDLTAAGVTILDSEPGPRWSHELRGPGAYGLGLEPVDHEAESCHAAFVDGAGHVRYVCVDPARHAADGASDLKVAVDEDDEDEDSEGGYTEDPARAAARREANELAAERKMLREERRAFVKTLIARADDALAVDIIDLAFRAPLYLDEGYGDPVALAFLDIDPAPLGVSEQNLRRHAEYADSSPKATPRAVAAAGASMLESLCSGYINAPRGEGAADIDYRPAIRSWLKLLEEEGYTPTWHDEELAPDPKPPTDDRPDDAGGWYDDPDEGPRWVTEAELEVIKGIDPDRLHLDEAGD